MLPDLTGKTAIITGSNSGIGKETALVLARHGANVVVCARDDKKGSEAAAEIAKEVGAKPGQVRYMKLNLGSLKSVQDFAHTWMQGNESIHMLVLNAGIMKAGQPGM